MSGLAIIHLYWWMGWLCYVPVFYLLKKHRFDVRNGMLAGAITGITQAAITQSWAFPIVAAFTGHAIFPGIFVWLSLLLFYAAKFMLLFGLAAMLFEWSGYLKKWRWLIPPTLASAYVALEALISFAFRGSPWLYHFFGYTQASNIWFLQLAELGGVGVISWFLVMINLLLASYLAGRNKRSLLAAMALLLIIHSYGLVRMHTLVTPGRETLKLALICDNSPAELRWSESEVNNYIQGLIGLNRQAVMQKPDIIVWNESVIPWTYRADDDFLLYILEQGRETGASHLISYFSEPDPGQDNPALSAYFIYPDGQVAGRYDKSELLAGVEKPLFSLFGRSFGQVSFALDNTHAGHAENLHPEPITSHHATIGVMICNESTRDMVAGKLAKQGVDFMVLMSNNAWLNVSTITRLHFFYTRLRAVENRTSIAVNANQGISGLIDHTGKILLASDSTEPHVFMMEVPKNKANTNFLRNRTVFHLFVFATLAAGVAMLFLLIRKPGLV
ncbi:MAG: apolipoprotein N-acyltransferase [Bacteroidia bacterium]|nr:MAG: apolipoprotein N-acyltransferase [Bacteroidia bacterium]